MKRNSFIISLAIALGAASAGIALAAPAAGRDRSEVERQVIERRAVEAVNWGMPAVNFELMLQAAIKTGGGVNQVVYWSGLLDWKNQTLTPNPNTIYLMPIYDTRDGPVVLEIPPADGGNITGSIDDGWQNPLEDVGPAGMDKGKGGKYLILPPGYDKPVPDGYFALQSLTNRGFALLRSNLKSGSDADVAAAVDYGKRIKFYPLSQAAGDTRFLDAKGILFDSTIPYDIRFFESLDRFVQAEPWLTRDKVMIDSLKSIGIEKGKPFAPDDEAKSILAAAAGDAREWIEGRYEAVFEPPFAEGARWALPASKEVTEVFPTFFADPNRYPVDGRAVTYSMAFFSAKHLGAGQFYLMTIKDKDGDRLDGGRNYRLSVPPKAPAKLYWSVTAYDGRTHAFIRDSRWSSRGSNTPGIQANADGSVDLYFGPSAPAGKESNWVPTKAHEPYELLFRIYGPEQPFFDKTWRLPDVEKAP